MRSTRGRNMRLAYSFSQLVWHVKRGREHHVHNTLTLRWQAENLTLEAMVPASRLAGIHHHTLTIHDGYSAQEATTDKPAAPTGCQENGTEHSV